MNTAGIVFVLLWVIKVPLHVVSTSICRPSRNSGLLLLSARPEAATAVAVDAGRVVVETRVPGGPGGFARQNLQNLNSRHSPDLWRSL